MKVRSATTDDAAAIAEIYNHYVANSHATFEIEPVDVAEMKQRINMILDGGYPFVVCEAETREPIGYAYGHQFKGRPAYKQSIEVSIYVHPEAHGQKIGTRLYEVLLSKVGKLGFHTAIAGISLPNDASIRLHEKLGFQKVAHFREVGRKFDRWIDVGYWQLFLQINE
jgi:L-amino acid N-acyltransferase YncA